VKKILMVRREQSGEKQKEKEKNISNKKLVKISRNKKIFLANKKLTQ
jgi:hypothetical protein